MYLIQRLEVDTQIHLTLDSVSAKDIAGTHWSNPIRILTRQVEWDGVIPGFWLAFSTEIPIRVERVYKNGTAGDQWIDLPHPKSISQEFSRFRGQSQILQMDVEQPIESLCFNRSLVAVLSMGRFKRNDQAAFSIDAAPGWSCIREEVYQAPKAKPDRLLLASFKLLQDALNEGFPVES